MAAVQETVEQVKGLTVDQYKYGFYTDIESEKAPKGSTRISSGSFPQERVSPNGCSNGALTPIGAG